MKWLLAYICTACLLLSISSDAQNSAYLDSLKNFRSNYIESHEVITGKERSNLQFFPINEKYRVLASTERIFDAPWFNIETSSGRPRVYRTYAVIHFTIDGTKYKLQVYQSKELLNNSQYADYLILPFTDLTCGNETYENGRYIDLTTGLLEAETVIIDFNKAYNPYCAYISNRYSCPIPPKENSLPVAIKAGEKKYGEAH